MANPEELIRQGDIASALAALQDVIRSNPGNAKHRVFLFQLLCLMGDWKRAVAQVRLAAELDPAAIPMAQTYREAIICEVYREKVFAGEKDPLVLGEPQPWIALLVEANRLLAAGNSAQAADLRDKAFEAAPTASGTLNDTPFEWIADADMRLGPILEVIVNGKYYWLPFDNIATISFDPPEDLRDLVWAPAMLSLPNEGRMAALVPTRYPGTTKTDDTAALMSRATVWTDAGGETFVGTGQRILTTDTAEIPLLETKSITLGSGGGADG